MKVLGLSPLDKDSTVTLMEDGKVLFAAGEERFTRVKLQNGFPWQSLQNALDLTGTRAEDIDVVSYPFLGWQEETRLFERNISNEREFLDDAATGASSDLLREAAARVPNRETPIPGLRTPNEKMEKGLAKTLAYRVLGGEGVVSRNIAKRGSAEWSRTAGTFHRKWHEELESGLEELQLGSKLKRVDHHLSHAANAFYTSDFDEALIVRPYGRYQSARATSEPR